MLVEQTQFNKKEFMNLFQKRFYSFCEKSPLFLRFTVLDDSVLVYDLSKDPENRPVEFKFDFSKDEKENIATIRNYLVENNYPVLTVTESVSRKLDAMEVQDLMVNQKLSFKEASEKRVYENFDKKYRVEKIFNMDNRVAIRDLDSNTVALYNLKIPASIFIRELYHDEAMAIDIFKTKMSKMKRITTKHKT